MNADVTQILHAIDRGDPRASDQLMPLVYEELRRLATAKMRQEQAGQTLQATALVHEAYLRLVGSEQTNGWNSRGHFFGAAAESMRRILVDRARKKQAVRHGGGMDRVALEDMDIAVKADDERLLAIDEALSRLAERDPKAAELVKLRFFAGLTNQDAAKAMGMAERSANRLWAYARACLYRDLSQP